MTREAIVTSASFVGGNPLYQITWCVHAGWRGHIMGEPDGFKVTGLRDPVEVEFMLDQITENL